MENHSEPSGMAFSKPDLIARGISRHRWKQLLDAGHIVRVGRSHYVAATPEVQHLVTGLVVLDPAFQYVARTLAAQHQVKAPTLAGDLTAAQLHRLSLPYPRDGRITLLAEPTTAKPHRYPNIRVLPRHVPDAHRTRLLGIAVTTPARTVADVARRHRLRDALVVGDSAFRDGLDPEEVQLVLDTMAGIPHVRKAREAVAFMDGVRESALESESYAFFVEREIPLPQCQEWIGSDRVDFLWRSRRVVGEADGRVKYLDHLGDDQGDGDALWLEKGRQNRVEDQGYRFVRWTYRDLRRRPDELERRIRRELGR